MRLDRATTWQAEPYFNTFVTSPMYKRLLANQGTKIMTVSHVDSPDENVEIEGQVVVGRSKNLEGTGILLKHDHKVSREHCRLDVGPLVTLVTDLGSSKGTRVESKSGKKITAEVLLPGQALFMGGDVLTYNLGGPKLRPAESPSPPTKKKSSGSSASRRRGPTANQPIARRRQPPIVRPRPRRTPAATITRMQAATNRWGSRRRQPPRHLTTPSQCHPLSLRTACSARRRDASHQSTPLLTLIRPPAPSSSAQVRSQAARRSSIKPSS